MAPMGRGDLALHQTSPLAEMAVHDEAAGWCRTSWRKATRRDSGRNFVRPPRLCGREPDWKGVGRRESRDKDCPAAQRAPSDGNRRSPSHCRPPLNRSLPKQIRLVGDLMICPWRTSFGVACTLDFPQTRISKLRSHLGRSVDQMLSFGTPRLVRVMPRKGPTMLPDCSLPAEPPPQRRLGLLSPSAAMPKYRCRRAAIRRSGPSGPEVRLSAYQAIYFGLKNLRAAHSLPDPDACPRIARTNSV